MARKRAKKEQPSGPAMTEQEREELDARLARMFTKPNRGEVGGGFFLLWQQRDDSGSPQIMTWHPETEAEIRAATLFYDAAHGLGDFAKPVRRGKPVRRAAEHDAMIKTILQNREDDTGYLVYADYLTENGNSQGDFIRLCVEVNRLPSESPEAVEKDQQLNDLLAAHAEEWYAPLGELGLQPVIFGTYAPWLWMSPRTGVIEEVSIDRPGILPKNATRLFAAAPFLRKIGFEREHLDPAGLAKVKELAQIEELDLGYTDLATEGLRVLLRSSNLSGLKTLNLNGNSLGVDGGAALAAWPGLAKLESLSVARCELGEGVGQIVASERLANMKTLHIGHNLADSNLLFGLFRSPHVKRLTELDLGGTSIDQENARLFGTAAFSSSLTHLELDSASFESGAFGVFTRCKLPALQSLKLNSVHLRAAEIGLLAKASWSKTLTELHLDISRFGAAGTESLVRGKFPQLAKLDLSRNRLGNRGGIALARAAKNFPALTNLRLWDNGIGAEAVTQLAKSALLANLTDFDLNGNKIGVAGAIALAKSKHLTKLTSLIVDEKQIGKKGKQALLDRFGEHVMNFR